MKRLIPSLVMGILLLQACGLRPSPAEIAATRTPQVPATAAMASPAPATLTTTPNAQPPVPIVYYYFIAIASNTYPAGSVVIVPGELILGPTLSKIARSTDPVTNISSALQAMMDDPRNPWKSADLGITSITLKDGAANVVLQGEYSAPGDAVLLATRYQVLLTVFSESTVQSAVVTLNGENIANLGISKAGEAKPPDYAFTRQEIESFMAENAYMP